MEDRRYAATVWMNFTLNARVGKGVKKEDVSYFVGRDSRHGKNHTPLATQYRKS